MTDKEALKLALEAFKTIDEAMPFPVAKLAQSVIKETLAQPEQEPVAYLCENAAGHKYFRWKKPSSVYKPIPLYTSPLQRTEQNFCIRCGKRTKDIHTCTPPKETT